MMMRALIVAGPNAGHVLVPVFSLLLQAPVASLRVARTALMKLLRKSDYERWANLNNYLEWWSSRTERIANLIPSGSRVLEFGAGNRRLESLLPPNCTYLDSDLVGRSPRTVICDLNKRPLPDLRYLIMHMAVFVGVLEYVDDLSTLVQWLAGQFTVCIVSYECMTSKRFSLSRLAKVFHRAYHGYMSYYTKSQLVALFDKNGFVCKKTEAWRDQTLFVFAKADNAFERPNGRLAAVPGNPREVWTEAYPGVDLATASVNIPADDP